MTNHIDTPTKRLVYHLNMVAASTNDETLAEAAQYMQTLELELERRSDQVAYYKCIAAGANNALKTVSRTLTRVRSFKILKQPLDG